MKRKKWTRKYPCPHCKNKAGSFHNRSCPLAYQTIGKMIRPSLKDKIKQKLINLIIKL